jgi:hypothetical protein
MLATIESCLSLKRKLIEIIFVDSEKLCEGRPRCRPAELGWQPFIANATVVLASRNTGRVRPATPDPGELYPSTRNIHDGGLRYSYV